MPKNTRNEVCNDRFDQVSLVSWYFKLTLVNSCQDLLSLRRNSRLTLLFHICSRFALNPFTPYTVN